MNVSNEDKLKTKWRTSHIATPKSDVEPMAESFIPESEPDTIEGEPSTTQRRPRRHRNETSTATASQFTFDEYDPDAPTDKLADEVILFEPTSSTEDVPSEQDPEPEPENIYESANNPYSFKSISKTTKQTITNIKTTIVEAPTRIVSTAISAINRNSSEQITDDDRQVAQKMMETHIVRVVGLFMSMIVIINWWFIWNYTTFTFNFKSILDLSICRPFYYFLEPVLTVIEFFNYYLINMRMDANVSPEMRDSMRMLWDYRPIVWTALYIFFYGIMNYFPLGTLFFDILTGDIKQFTAGVVIASVLTACYLNLTTDRLFTFMGLVQVIFFVIFIILFILVGVTIVSSGVVGLFSIYLFAISHFAILYYNWFNPYSVYLKCVEMMTDLTTAPVSNPSPSTATDKVKNGVFRHLFDIVFFCVAFGVFFTNMTESLQLKHTTLSANLIATNAVGLLILYAFYYEMINKAVGIGIEWLYELYASLFGVKNYDYLVPSE